MAAKPLYIAFLWHMHQPYYKDPATGLYRLPWVRLHGVKDYLDMVTILDEFPAIRQNVNVVPSLLKQLSDYLDNGARDIHLDLTMRKPDDLAERERAFIIENFFLANWDNMIKPFPRYFELLAKRGFQFTKKDILRVLKYYTDDDIRDLQVLFNLSWIDPVFRNEDPHLRELVVKERHYTEDDKAYVIARQFEILRQILPAYERADKGGQVEFSVTPFYHPILPLLWDTETARIAMPHAHLPNRRFAHPEDAVKQMRLGIEYYTRLFGHPPSGMWPSEGSVSEEVVRAIGAEGITWVATDEEVLVRSLDRPLRSHEGLLTDPATLYRPYRYAGVTIFFRDHKLSDLIGFVYSGWDPEKAADDLIGKLLHLREMLPNGRAHLVPIILDGENAWEYYRNDGRDFLRAVYGAISRDDRIRSVTFSDFIQEHGPGEELQRLHAGSWINGDFSIWIGHEEDNIAWDYLSTTRDDLEAFSQEHPEALLKEAWEAMYAAEGSDWNWWYGDEHATETQEEFDELFRGYLKKVYIEIGKDVPQFLHVPVLLDDREFMANIQIRGFIHPTIDGVVTNYFEWHQAASFEMKRSGGSMHRSDSLVSTIHCGFNMENLYIRIDPTISFEQMLEHVLFHFNIVHQAVFKVVVDLQETPLRGRLFKKMSDEEWSELESISRVAFKEILEVEVPFAAVEARENIQIHLSVDVVKNHEEIKAQPTQRLFSVNTLERCPWRGYLSVKVPSQDYEKIMWY